MQKKDFWLLVTILILASALRGMQPDLVEFKRDEATVTRLGQAIAYEGYRPVVGVDSSVGIDNLPLNLYLMAIALRIHPDPLSAVILTIFLNTAAVGVCYWLTHRTYGRVPAVIATTLFAVSPWAVLYARKVWSLELPLFTLAFIISCIAVFVWDKKWALVAAVVSLAVLVGLHLGGLAFVPIFGMAVLIYRDKVAWKPLIIGGLLGGLLFLPYLIHDAQQNWTNLRGLLSFSGTGDTFSWDSLRYALTMVGSTGIEGQAGVLYKQFKDSVPNLWIMNDLMTYIVVASLIYTVVQTVSASSTEKRRYSTLWLLWFIIPIVLQLRASAPPQRHYLVLLYPVQFIMVAVTVNDGVQWLRSKLVSIEGERSHVLKGVSYFLILVLLIWNVWQIAVTVQLRSYMISHPTTGGYGIPLRYSRQAAANAVKLSEGAEIIVATNRSRPMMTETPTVFDTLLFGHPHRIIDARGAMVFPAANRAVYLVTPFERENPYPPLVGKLVALDTVAAGPVAQLTGEVAYRTYMRHAPDTTDVTENFTALAAGVPFANNVVFASYDLDGSLQPGGFLRVWLAWWTHGPPPANIDYHFTVQLLNDGGGGDIVITQDDHVAFPADYWQGGDLVLSYFALPLPKRLLPGTYGVQAGMYSYPDIVAVPVIDADGKAVDDGVVLAALEYGK
ncbi:MAG: hypothetical protein P1S60_03285 [Anaerolineae bacterium]|nr:hypothetical protein [Anaerolineae bacterium]